MKGGTLDASAIEAVSNFRLRLGYSAAAPFELVLAGTAIELPAGDSVVADVSFEHIANESAVIHVQRPGDLQPVRVEVPDSEFSDGKGEGAELVREAGKGFSMDGSFTLAARFRTDGGNGTLAARAPAEGKWQPNGKALFLRRGRLHYDIGWVGVMGGGPKVNDGAEHLGVLSVDDKGQAEMWVDREVVATKKDFSSEDDPKHVFKVGSTATDFGGDFERGRIEQVLFWKRALTTEDRKLLEEGKLDELNTPDYHWRPERSSGRGKRKEAPELVSFGAVPGYAPTVGLRRAEGVRFTEAWIQGLERADHRELVATWDKESFQRGEKIYAQLCVTCHGTETQEGSIPLSLKFHEGQFKNGSDPFRMWQTLSNGFGLMTPMPQYSTSQKYDVIHYIREHFLAKSNPTQLTDIDEEYLTGLPRGLTLVEEERIDSRPPQYQLMDFGNVLFWTYQIEPGDIGPDVNIAQKGIAIRLDPGSGGVSKGTAWAVYDHDTMRLAAFHRGQDFVDWKGIAFDGSHGTHTSLKGELVLANRDQAGWADPATGSWDAPRVMGKDGRAFGPIPREWAKFRGLHYQDQGATLEYEVGGVRVLEEPRLEEGSLIRVLTIGPSKRELKLRVSREREAVFPSSEEERTLVVRLDGSWESLPSGMESPGGKLPSVVPVVAHTQIVAGEDEGGFAVDVLTVPDAELNAHQSWMRTSGFDFYPDGKRAAVCTWMGDVWIVEGIDQKEGQLTWKRICSGLFQPLGLKIVDGSIYVTCRDMLARLHDKNGDETIDFVESFNNDHQVTEHFHEFAMGLQADAAGNFYYAKSARHAKDSLVPHHGTLLRVSPDGERTDILATGFRAANGVCLNPDGTFVVTDQEGHWNPKNRINWVNGDGPEEFFGNIYGYSPVTDESDEAMSNPLCWITNAFDRSPSELLWVPKEAGWGELNGQLLNLSYGYGKIYVVPFEDVNGQKQGGMCQLPIKALPTGVMRGRFHPADGQLYACGMFAWAGTQRQAGGFYRIRRTEHAAWMPVSLSGRKGRIVVTLSDAVDPAAVMPSSFEVKAWDLERTKRYGSKHLNERNLKVTSAKLGEDGKTLHLEVPELDATWGLSIRMGLRGATENKEFERLIHGSFFELEP